MSSVPIEIVQDSIVIHATVEGQDVGFILDTGDAIGPVFNAEDAKRLQLEQGPPIDVEGAGGESQSFSTTASITFDDRTYDDESGSIDADLMGSSLLGLPFFLARCSGLAFDFDAETLTLT